MSSENKTVNKFNIKDYQELIDTLAKVEYKKLSSKHLIDFSELAIIRDIDYGLINSISEKGIYTVSAVGCRSIKIEINSMMRTYFFE